MKKFQIMILGLIIPLSITSIVTFGYYTDLFPKQEILQGNEIRPNILVIMVDDLDVGSLKTTLEYDLMPNLQTFIIDKGTAFTNSFCCGRI